MAFHIAASGANAGRPVRCPAKHKCTLQGENGAEAPHFDTAAQADAYIVKQAAAAAEASGGGVAGKTRQRPPSELLEAYRAGKAGARDKVLARMGHGEPGGALASGFAKTPKAKKRAETLTAVSNEVLLAQRDRMKAMMVDQASHGHLDRNREQILAAMDAEIAGRMRKASPIAGAKVPAPPTPEPPLVEKRKYTKRASE